MSIRKFWFVLSLIVCAALAACSARGAAPIVLTNKDAGSTVHVKQGGVLSVALEGNPTTGYTWEQAPDGSDQLTQQGEPEFKPDSSALGSGGMMTLRFQAGQPGTYPLKLIYHRTFEPNVPPLQTFDATIVIDP